MRINFTGETKYVVRLFSVGSGDEIAFKRVMRYDLEHEEAKIFLAEENILCAEDVCLL